MVGRGRDGRQWDRKLRNDLQQRDRRRQVSGP
jgi:hypothetical protein